MLRASTVAAALAALAIVAVPTGGAARATPPARLHVDLTEWALVPSGGVVAAGPVEVTVRNVGRVPHELAVIATDQWGQPLFVRNGRAVGSQVGRAVVVGPGQTRSARIYLSHGTYVLLDNLRGHYGLGVTVSILAR